MWLSDGRRSVFNGAAAVLFQGEPARDGVVHRRSADGSFEQGLGLVRDSAVSVEGSAAGSRRGSLPRRHRDDSDGGGLRGCIAARAGRWAPRVLRPSPARVTEKSYGDAYGGLRESGREVLPMAPGRYGSPIARLSPGAGPWNCLDADVSGADPAAKGGRRDRHGSGVAPAQYRVAADDRGERPQQDHHERGAAAVRGVTCPTANSLGTGRSRGWRDDWVGGDRS